MSAPLPPVIMSIAAPPRTVNEPFVSADPSKVNTSVELSVDAFTSIALAAATFALTVVIPPSVPAVALDVTLITSTPVIVVANVCVAPSTVALIVSVPVPPVIVPSKSARLAETVRATFAVLVIVSPLVTSPVMETDVAPV